MPTYAKGDLHPLEAHMSLAQPEIEDHQNPLTRREPIFTTINAMNRSAASRESCEQVSR